MRKKFVTVKFVERLFNSKAVEMLLEKSSMLV